MRQFAVFAAQFADFVVTLHPNCNIRLHLVQKGSEQSLTDILSRHYLELADQSLITGEKVMRNTASF